MAKRYTDTNKWDKNWWGNLNNDERITWVYMLDKCDHAGIMDLNLKLLNFHCNTAWDKESFEKAFHSKIQHVDEDKVFIESFIDFQYGELFESNRVHASVIEKLKRFGLDSCKALARVINDPKEKEKDKDKKKKSPISTKSKEIDIPALELAQRLVPLYEDFFNRKSPIPDKWINDWAKQIELLRKKDKRDYNEQEQIMTCWEQHYRECREECYPECFSGKAWRQKFDKLALRMKETLTYMIHFPGEENEEEALYQAQASSR